MSNVQCYNTLSIIEQRSAIPLGMAECLLIYTMETNVSTTKQERRSTCYPINNPWQAP